MGCTLDCPLPWEPRGFHVRMQECYNVRPPAAAGILTTILPQIYIWLQNVWISSLITLCIAMFGYITYVRLPPSLRATRTSCMVKSRYATRSCSEHSTAACGKGEVYSKAKMRTNADRRERVESRGLRAESWKQRAKSREQRAESREKRGTLAWLRISFLLGACTSYKQRRSQRSEWLSP
jgi:hypothetical protein